VFEFGGEDFPEIGQQGIAPTFFRAFPPQGNPLWLPNVSNCKPNNKICQIAIIKIHQNHKEKGCVSCDNPLLLGFIYFV